MLSQQHPWHWLMKQTPCSQDQSWIYCSVFLFCGWWSLESKNINPIASVCYKRLTDLIGLLSDARYLRDELLIQVHTMNHRVRPFRLRMEHTVTCCGLSYLWAFDPPQIKKKKKNWSSEAGVASCWMPGMRRMTQRSRQELAERTSITPLLRCVGGL